MTFATRLERLSLTIEKIAGVFLAAITILVFVSAIGRYLFATPLPDSFDISRLMMGVAVLWGFASVGYRGSHIKVDLIAEWLPDRVRRWLDILAWTVLLGFTLALTWMLLTRVSSAYSSGEATFDLRIPVWPFLAVIWLGVLASVFTIFSRIALLLLDERSKLEHYETVEADIEEGPNS
ncbi:TRAP transporter small permease [Breoghania sp. L-A4]|uniref:TRAP transporter small permease n=1 Tax=Breoghania sp. L-A4 TaxID=2304600 RepID=UPI000E35BA0F|nr:TRAP transporter small permease [Breoghania sp. L-A4]AXS42220.1 TRAP transporter small permease [Breoghania sp. L-A4]